MIRISSVVIAFLGMTFGGVPECMLCGNEAVQKLIQSSCLECHGESTETGLDLSGLGYALDDTSVFTEWTKVFDRVVRGEMPPKDAAQPEVPLRSAALVELEKDLIAANLVGRSESGRVPSRRLARKEYQYVLHDLLGIGGSIAKHLPPENDAASFDVVASKQEMSSVHVQGFLTAADLALDEAIMLGPAPQMRPRELDYFNSKYIQMWVDRPVRNGGGTIFKTDRDVVTFRGANYVLRSDNNGFRIQVPGNYRITVTAAAHNPRSSISVSLKRQNDSQGESELFGAWDLSGDEYREVSLIKYLRPDDYFYVSADELDPAPNGQVIYNSQPASSYQGEGVKIHKVVVQGPLETSWPPQRTRDLFPGIEWRFQAAGSQFGRFYHPVFTKPQIDHLREIVSAFAPKAFGRVVSETEIDALVSLAKPDLDAGRDFIACARIPLRAMLISPELLFHVGDEGKLNQYELAGRLATFLWRSLPDDELLGLAAADQLNKSSILIAQVDRMLADEKGRRFVEDFLDQWLELRRIDETTPDAYLFPEYDDVLRRAMLAETRLFFTHLIEENLSVANLIDSKFTFMNRKLAEHYDVPGVLGEQMRKVQLGPDSVRGGVLTHAVIAKITANGTVTTPVKRGNFVLSNLLGMPPNPPPPGIGSIEPDTRGATTIRETLAKHQENVSCAMCHKKIDPPGFALESFDPVGNYRKNYRNSRGITREVNAGLRYGSVDYDLGRSVDSSGVTVEGVSFNNIRDYKQHLLGSTEQVARNVLSKLMVFATGGEIEFADRAEIERILQETEESGYPMRNLLHQVVLSRMFRER